MEQHAQNEGIERKPLLSFVSEVEISFTPSHVDILKPIQASHYS